MLAYVQDWDFILRYQDEHSYMLQLQMLARGRLWMPAIPPEIAGFFSSYAVLASPRYGSIYFPGTALMDVAGIWLHLPFWAIPLLTAGASVGLCYRIVTELVDGEAGALAAVMMASLPTYRSLSLMLLSQTPMLLLGLLLIWAWLRWRKSPCPAWVLAMGALAGWALITRPLDALAYIVPVCWAMLAERRNRVAPNLSLARLQTAALFAVAAAPFLLLQAVQNSGMTGSWIRPPEAQFAAENFPAPMLGFHRIDWSHAPKPKLPEDRELLETSTWPAYRAHQIRNLPAAWWKERLPRTLQVTLPNPLLATLIPVGLLGLTDRRRRVLAGATGMFCLLYSLSVWYQAHYIMVIVPGVLLMTMLGIAQARLLWPGLSPIFALVVVAMSIGAFAETDPDNWSQWMDLVRIESNLATLPPDPAVVLFRYHPNDPVVNVAHHEPVYNTDTPWPDDARIIRAHDLGAQNIRLFQYYARTQPWRVIYLYDRDGDTLTRLGTAAEAARNYDGVVRRNEHVR